MRLTLLALCLCLAACAQSPTRSKPIVSGDYAEVAGYRIRKLGIVTPVYHCYIAGQYADTNEWWTYEKLSNRQPDGSHLRFRQSFNGVGSVFAAYSGNAARRLLDACNSPEAKRDGKRYDTVGDNSNEWVKDRLKQAGLKADLPWGALSE